MGNLIRSISIGLVLVLAFAKVSAQNVVIDKDTVTRLKLRQVPLELQGDKKNPVDIQSLFKKPNFKIPQTKIDQLKKESNSGGGWGSSGGGSGVACFRTDSDAEVAQKYIARNEALPHDLIEKMQSLEVLDYWEWKQYQEYEIIDASGKSTEQILNLVQKNMSVSLPLFAYQLEQAGAAIEIAQWDPKVSVPRIFDADPKFALPDNCRLVQLAARHTKESYKAGNGPSDKTPTVKVEVNKDLYQRLDNLNKAILIVHEQLYLLGQMTGHSKSNDIRKVVMNFFNLELDKVHPTSKTRMRMRTNLIYLFGDYVKYFSADQGFVAEPFSQESRFTAYTKLNEELRRRMGLCIAGNLPKEEMIEWIPGKKNHTCVDYVMNLNILQKWVPDEWAFVYVASYIIDQSMGFLNSEYMFTPFADPVYVERANKHIEFMCGYVKREKSKWFHEELIEKTLRYCEGALKALSPKGKDQN